MKNADRTADGSDESSRSLGYRDPSYCAALREFGTPTALARSGGWILRRPIFGSPDLDAAGCYPLFSCANWPGLEGDLEVISLELISVVLVADPLGAHDQSLLRSLFPDLVRPFKEHYVADLIQPPGAPGSAHHRYYTRWSRRRVQVELENRPGDRLEEWTDLYAGLVRRRSVRGIARFSRSSFESQLRIPGLVMFRALELGVPVGAQLWLTDGPVAYSHLTALSDRGYRTRAAYALMAAALEYFAGKVRWLDLGGTAGLSDDADDGLASFKEGWATEKRTAYLCGRIFDHSRYAALVEETRTQGSSFFPAYRDGEHG
jgi:hypothetical protein